MTEDELKRLLELAESGDAEKQFELGKYYRAKMEYEDAFVWFLKSAEQGNSDAQVGVGTCYLGGVDYDYEKALPWFMMAAEQDNPIAQMYVGFCYMEGPKDYRKAFHWFLKSAKNGDYTGQAFLSGCYDSGIGVKENKEKAFYWMSKAAKKGKPYYMHNVAICCEKGIGTKQNYRKALKIYREIYNQGHYYVCSKLGQSWLEGWIGKIDYYKAIQYFKEGIEKGDFISSYYLGICYLEGKGVSRNIVQAIRFLEEAAERNVVDSIKKLGEIYSTNEYGVENIKLSMEYLALAKELGDSKAEHLFELYRRAYNSTNMKYIRRRAFWNSRVESEYSSDVELEFAVRNNNNVSLAIEERFAEYRINPRKKPIKNQDRTIYEGWRLGSNDEPIKNDRIVFKVIELPMDPFVKNADTKVIRDRINELDMLVKLRGATNIIELYDYEIILDKLIIVMRHMTTLQKYAESNELSERDLVKIGLDICNALRVLGNNEPAIVHRDIKPSNLFVSSEKGNVIYVLGDFGISGYVDNMDTLLKGNSTLLYRPPEGCVNTKSDIYSLGLTLFQMASEGVLLSGDFDKSQEDCYLTMKPEIISDELWNVIQSMCSISPFSRPELEGLIDTFSKMYNNVE